jgi:hypothetical protein
MLHALPKVKHCVIGNSKCIKTLFPGILLYTHLFVEEYNGIKTPEASNSNSHSHACGNGIMICCNTGGVKFQ